MRQIFNYIIFLLPLSACASFDTTQVRNVLSHSIVDIQGSPIHGSAANHFSAQLDKEHLRLSFGSSDDCEYERVARERVLITTTSQPRATQWRVGGRAFIMTSVLGTLGLVAGAGLLAAGFYDDRPFVSATLWASGGALLLGGTLAIGNVLYIARRTRSRTEGPQLQDRPMEILQRACEASPYRYATLRLRQGDHRFEFGTDRAGQLSLLRRQLRWLGLGDGTWEVESAGSGRLLGSLTIPPVEPGRCDRYRTAVRPAISLKSVGINELRLPGLERRAEVLVDQIFAPRPADLGSTGTSALLLAGTLSAQPDLVSVQVGLIGNDGQSLGWREATAPALDESIARTVARLADELLCETS